MRRAIRVSLTLLVTGLCTAYVLWKIDLSRTADVMQEADLGYLLLALVLMVVTILPMAWRWQLLLRAKGVHDQLPWLTRAYFVSYAAGQVLPTSVGGDAVRIYETAKRHPGHGNTAAASVLLERAIGGAATLILAAFGFVLAVGHYDVGPYLWVEGLFVVATIVFGFVLFSRPYYVMGPLLFLVMLVPFTVNGLAVRESFFVSFLGDVGIDADRAFAAGFLFFVVTVVMAAPGAFILAWEGLRGSGRARLPREADG
jgi:uncharacterized membrane protein YbhN (UPF0104 family)